ncbi:Beta-Ig-H3/fasciclin [unidentified eubacterium SCB49]|nr:Beta-Ig-H3/fasciclin [unidentified eubacterium SCB49]
MKNLLKFTLALFLTIPLISCGDDDTDDVVMENDDITIAEFVATNSDYSSLAAALDVAGLTATLDGTTEFTVFAPNNAAFSTFLSANGFTALDEVPVSLLREVLLNHVINGELEAEDLTTGYVNTLATYNGEADANLSMYLNTTSGVTINGDTNVTLADVDVDNGVIHAVDNVIALPTVVTFALADSNTFSSLVAALTRDDQPDFVSVLTDANGGDGNAPFTVLAPTNTAFEDLLVELGATSLADIDGATLTSTLNNHVIAGANVRAEDLQNGIVSTLGEDIIIDADNATITDNNGRVSEIVVVNVQAANGVVHAISKVLLPTL